MLILEWFVIDQIRKLKQKGQIHSRRDPIARWAFRMLTLVDFAEIRELEFLEVQIRAWARLAVLAYEGATSNVRPIWTSSAPPTGGRPSLRLISERPPPGEEFVTSAAPPCPSGRTVYR